MVTRNRIARHLDPWNILRRLENEMDAHFRGITSGVGYDSDATVWTGDAGMILSVDLPGVDPESIDISVEGQELTVSAELPGSPLGEEDRFLVQERGRHTFTRTARLPFHMTGEDVEANYDRGVLTLTINKPEAEKPAKIPVKRA